MDRHPPLLASISDSNPNDAICTIRNSIFDGADGFLFHLEKMDSEYRNKESFNKMFEYVGERPIMTVNYPSARYSEMSDDELMELQHTAIEAGAACCDIRGDTFGDKSRCQLSMNPAVIKRQMDEIEKIHSLGGQALMSTHIFDEFLDTEQIIKHAKEMESRGPDIVKIAIKVNSAEEMAESYKSTVMLKKELKVPILHICMGPYGRAHRAFGPVFGSCLVFCVQQYTQAGHKDKPLLRATRDIYNNLDYMHL